MAILSLARPSLLASLVATYLGTLVACGGGGGATSPAASTSTPRPVATSDAADPSCPMAVTGTSVSVEDTSTGAALVFVTTSDVIELRKRVSALAQMHNDRHGAMGPLPDGTEQAGQAGHDHAAHAAHAGHGAHGAHAGHAGHGDHAGHVMGAEHAAHTGHGAHGGHAGHAGHGDHAGHAGGMIGVHSKAEVEEVEGGAKITFIAFPADVAKMQNELRMHAQHLANGTCQMKHE